MAVQPSVKTFSGFECVPCVTRSWTYKYRSALRRKPHARDEERWKGRGEGEGERPRSFCSYLARTNFHASRILRGATNNYHHYAADIQIAFLTPTCFTLSPSSPSLFPSLEERDVYLILSSRNLSTASIFLAEWKSFEDRENVPSGSKDRRVITLDGLDGVGRRGLDSKDLFWNFGIFVRWKIRFLGVWSWRSCLISRYFHSIWRIFRYLIPIIRFLHFCSVILGNIGRHLVQSTRNEN